ncbi:hypothetical protein J7E88_28575 [Streptomyces sp. ISL-10]|nr:hypothetical protein [Streptomyces sp. ISL-10]
MLKLSSVLGHTIRMYATGRPAGADVNVHYEPADRRGIPEVAFAIRAHRHAHLHPRRRVCRCMWPRTAWGRAGLRVTSLSVQRSETGKHVVKKWEEGEHGWAGVRVSSKGLESAVGELVNVQFSPNGLEEMGPYLELRFEAEIDGVSIGEASQLFLVAGTKLLPAC